MTSHNLPPEPSEPPDGAPDAAGERITPTQGRTDLQRAARRVAKARVTWGERCFYSLVIAAVVVSFAAGLLPVEAREGLTRLSWALALLGLVAFGALLFVRRSPALDGTSTGASQ